MPPDYQELIRAENDAQEVYDDWCESTVEPTIRYEYRSGVDRLGRPGAWYVRTREYAAWCKERDRQWRRVEYRIRKREAHPYAAIEREERLARLREMIRR